MIYLKKILASIIGLAMLLILISAIILQIDNQKTSYLKIKNQPDLSTNSYVITNVNIVPMTSDTILMNKTIHIVDGIIKNINETSPNTNEFVIDAKGKYLSPGLIDMHTHLWDKYELGLYAANGVTTIRNLLGMPFHLDVKKDINNNKFIGPIMYTASPQFTDATQQGSHRKRIKTPDEARELVKKYKEKGYDYIKTYNQLPKAIFDATIEQSIISNIPIAAHPSFKVDYDYHFNSSISTIEHTEDIFQQPLNYKIDREKLNSVIDGYAKSNQTHSPTLTVFYNLTEIYNKEEGFLTTEQSGYINPFIKSINKGDYNFHMSVKTNSKNVAERVNDQHNFHLEIIGKLHKAGVNIVCSTDAGVLNTAAGFSIHQELGFYVEAGMSNYEALKTATVNPTKVYEEYNQFGIVEKGRMANLILSEENPLNDLTMLKTPEWVMIKGRIINKPLMKEFKEKAYKRNNYLSSMIRSVKYAIWK